MSDKKNKDTKSFKKAKIKEKNGLNVSYDKKELEKFIPHLISEITNGKKALKIDSVALDIENTTKKRDIQSKICNLNELSDPGAIDFIRRCTTNEEAFEILDYLLKKKELKVNEYEDFKNKISQKDGLKNLIEESGGFKKPGYYVEKYYKKELNTKKPKNKKV